ncbi:MAG: tetratricopeptide (TPR) repeat protein, partial [Planctomycetota bacterium]
MFTNTLSKFGLFAIALLAAAGCNSGPQEQDPEKLFALFRETAFYHWQNEDLPRTEQQLLRALQIHPEDKSCNLILGNIGIKRGGTKDLLKAEQIFRNIEDQEDFRTDLGLAEVLERLGVIYLESAAAIDTGKRTTAAQDPAARVAELRKMSKDAWVESRARYQEVLAAKPSQAKAVNGMQRVFALEGNYDASLYWTAELLDMVETDIIYFQAKLDQPGITENEEAELRSRMANTFDLAERSHMLAATMLHDMGRSEDALGHLTAAAEIVPRSADIWSHRAEILLDLNLFEACIEAVDQFLRLSPEEFDHPDIQGGYDLKGRAQDALANQDFEAKLIE